MRNNIFNDDVELYFFKVTEKSFLLCIINDTVPMRVYFANNKFYIRSDNGGRNAYKCVVKSINVTSDKKLIDKNIFNKIKTAHNESRVRFENAVLYNEFLELFF